MPRCHLRRIDGGLHAEGGQLPQGRDASTRKPGLFGGESTVQCSRQSARAAVMGWPCEMCPKNMSELASNTRCCMLAWKVCAFWDVDDNCIAGFHELLRELFTWRGEPLLSKIFVLIPNEQKIAQPRFCFQVDSISFQVESLIFSLANHIPLSRPRPSPAAGCVHFSNWFFGECVDQSKSGGDWVRRKF